MPHVSSRWYHLGLGRLASCKWRRKREYKRAVQTLWSNPIVSSFLQSLDSTATNSFLRYLSSFLNHFIRPNRMNFEIKTDERENSRSIRQHIYKPKPPRFSPLLATWMRLTKATLACICCSEWYERPRTHSDLCPADGVTLVAANCSAVPFPDIWSIVNMLATYTVHSCVAC